MASKKQYGDIDSYVKKLDNVMKRLDVNQYDYDWTKNSAYVKFFYKNKWYQFDHSVDKANASGKMHLVYGTDVFAQLVLALEDLSRMVERGIYDLSVWVSSMVMIEEKPRIYLPECFCKLGFTKIYYSSYPSLDDITKAYKEIAKEVHPDTPNGSEEAFKELTEAYNNCIRFLDYSGESY